MKKMLLTTFLFCAIATIQQSKAQVRFNVNVNIGARPNWGIPGNYAGDYYYLPEIDTYYDIPRRSFVYLQGNNWVFSASLPYMYRDYDLYRGYKVMVNEPRPYLRANFYRNRYSQYYNTYRRPAVIVQYPGNRYGRDMRDDRNYRDRDDHFRGNDRNDRGREYERDDRNERGRDHDNGGGRERRGRG